MARSEKQNRAWRHNGFRGYAALMQRNADAIYSAPSTTQEAKLIALSIERLAKELIRALEKRID